MTLPMLPPLVLHAVTCGIFWGGLDLAYSKKAPPLQRDVFFQRQFVGTALKSCCVTSQPLV